MAGIYIHIPFCKSKCAYCNFFSVVSEKQKKDFIEALKREAVARKSYIKDEDINTIYFGGGTPSLLSPQNIDDILEIISKYYNLAEKIEITLEANPDTLSKLKLLNFKEIGINRISIGIQSFFDDDLQYLSRRHDSRHAIQAIEWIQQVGFEKSTLDLIYGIPTLTEEKWNKNLDIFFSTGIEHLSAYALTVEPKTVLGQHINNGLAQPVEEDESVKQYEILVKRTAEKGFEHYEISNFAKPGYYSKHNSLYWKGGNYIGLGPSAHSFDGISRQWNISNLSEYVKLAGISDEIIEKETLTIIDRYNEYVMTSLRTSWGCDIAHIREVFGESYAHYFVDCAGNYILNGKMQKKESALILTEKGKLFADRIAADLFM